LPRRGRQRRRIGRCLQLALDDHGVAEVNHQSRGRKNREQHHHNPRNHLAALVGKYQACDGTTVPALAGVPRPSRFLAFTLVCSGFPHSLSPPSILCSGLFVPAFVLSSLTQYRGLLPCRSLHQFGTLCR